ncbi:MAG: hypothetical protein H7835_17810 [Magnetococcus sp. XQGC-1]
MSRIQRRTVSAIVSLAIEHELKKEGSRLFDDGGEDDNWEGKDESGVRYLPDRVWDPVEPDRLVKLAQNRPDLLTHHEQLMWKAIRENHDWCRTLGAKYAPNIKAIRRDWAAIQRQADEWEKLG